MTDDATREQELAAVVALVTMVIGLGLLGAATVLYLFASATLLVALALGVLGVGVFFGGSYFGYRAV